MRIWNIEYLDTNTGNLETYQRAFVDRADAEHFFTAHIEPTGAQLVSVTQAEIGTDFVVR